MIKRILRRIWNRLSDRKRRRLREKLELGLKVSDGEVGNQHLTISQGRRAEHIAILGKTGTGKSSLLRWFCGQDIEAGRGVVYFDLHGDATPFLLSRVALEERRQQRDLSQKLIWSLLQCPTMNIGIILAQLKAERDQLDRAITALEQVTGSSNRASRPRTRRRISAEGLAHIRAAQRARWAKARGRQRVVSIQSAKAGRRTMSASARRKIAAAQRARWAKLKRRKKNAGDNRATRL